MTLKNLILISACAFFFSCSPPEKEKESINYRISWSYAQLKNCPDLNRSEYGFLELGLDIINESTSDTLLYFNDNGPLIAGAEPSTFNLLVDEKTDSLLNVVHQLDWMLPENGYPYAFLVVNFFDKNMRTVNPGDSLRLRLSREILCYNVSPDSLIRAAKALIGAADLKYRLLINKDSLKNIYPRYHILDSMTIRKSDDFKFLDQYGNIVD